MRPPGELASYSNHGTALAGYIVAQVAGMPWEDYVEKNILEPLEMRHTMVRQPAADQMPDNMSKGYKYRAAKFDEQGFEYIPAVPAGSMSGSAGDLAKFMIAHMQNGRYGAGRILKEETARQMRDMLFTHDPTLAGMAYGFMLLTYNGERVVQHGGDTFLFHSYFVMLPERNVGFFVSYNTDTGARLREELFEVLLDRYYPALDAPEVKPAAEFDDVISRYAGSYGGIRYSYTSLAKLGALFGVATVSADGDALVVSGGEFARRFVEVEPRIFREVDGQSSLAFREDAAGHITHLFLANSPAVALVRLPWSETPLFNLLLVAGCLAVCVSALVGWPILAFAMRGTGVGAGRSRGSRRASWLAWIACLLIVVLFSLGIVAFNEPEEVAFAVPPLLGGLLWLTPIIAALAALLLVCTALAWKNRYWRLSGRLHYTVVFVAVAAFVWFLAHWNLLRFGA